MRISIVGVALAVAVALNAPASAQILEIWKGVQLVKKLRDLHLTDQEEQELGAAVSERIRMRYGVTQNRAMHRYVTLVGTLVAQAGSRPTLPWRFIVLDTDGVNAFAAPGGYIHVTRGALAHLRSEAELATVLAHEIAHVNEKHTISALRKATLVDIGADQTMSVSRRLLLSKVIDKTTDIVLAGFGRDEELESDRVGVRLATKIGYTPGALGAFLVRLKERNTQASGRQGLFASHPEMQERIDKLGKQIASEKLAGQAMLDARYKRHVAYRPTPQTAIALVEAGASGLAGGTKKDAAGQKNDGVKTDGKSNADAEPKKRRGFGLPFLPRPGGGEKQSAQVTGSGGSRGVDIERGAKGGPVSTAVAVKLTAAEIEAFRKEGRLGLKGG